MKLSTFLLPVCLFGLLLPRVSSAEPVCPSQNFSRFLSVFERKIEVQKAFTRVPLKVINFYETDFKKPYIVHYLNRDMIDYPVFLSNAYREAEGIQQTIKRKNKQYIQVVTKHIGGTGSDNVTYDFRKRRGCWYLVAKLDYST